MMRFELREQSEDHWITGMQTPIFQGDYYQTLKRWQIMNTKEVNNF